MDSSDDSLDKAGGGKPTTRNVGQFEQKQIAPSLGSQLEAMDVLVWDAEKEKEEQPMGLGGPGETEPSSLLVFDTRAGSSLRIFDSDEAARHPGVGGDFSLHFREEEGLAEQMLLTRGREVPTQELGQRVPDRGRLRVHNVGGSLTVLLQIALLAWGVRQLRSVLAKRRHKQAPRINTVPFRPCDPPLTSTLTAFALKKLVDSHCTAHLLIDVRFPEFSNEPSPFKNSINIPEAEIRTFFQLPEAERASRFPSARSLDRSQLLVFLSTKGRRAQRAAITAAELGYNGDAVAVLLQNKKQNSPGIIAFPNPYLVDVRRYDERALYGHIYGSVHVPVNEWPKALAMEPLDWQRSYGHPKFGKEDLVILYCRTNNRSVWASQVSHDAGVKRCFVCEGGVVGWRLDPNVLSYDGYALGDPPPAPHRFEVEVVNYESAERELQQLQLI